MIDKDEQEILHQIAEKMHPHLGRDNHTSRLIDKVANEEKLSSRDIFDLGKYYSRMFLYLDQSKIGSTEEFMKSSAILSLKSAVYSYKH